VTKTTNKRSTGWTTVAALLVVVCVMAMALAQGGDPRKNTNSANTGTKKPSTTKTTPPRKPSETSRPTTTSFRPQNPGIELVRIPAGIFMMGSTDGLGNEKPVHRVTINYFYMGKYEVTQAQWQAVMGNNPSKFKGCAHCPVETVSWYDAQDFVNRLNEADHEFKYRLPSEAEWEYACRGGTTGDYWSDVGEIGWYSDNSGEKTHPVGGIPSNAFGLYDMPGNVKEWCEDWYHPSYDGAPADGSAWLTGGEQKHRVLRGGDWNGINVYVLRSPLRSGVVPPDGLDSTIGFRVVASVRTK
jgi:formylglycine-generating enzyme required for sulfatase activity